MRSRTPFLRPQDMLLLAGWVFADLLLGLTVLFLAAAPGGQPPTPTVTPTSFTPTLTATIKYTPTATRTPSLTPTPTLTPMPTRTITPTPTLTPCPVVLETNPRREDFELDLNAVWQGGNGDTRQMALFKDQVRQRLNGAPRAGFVLVYGYAPKNDLGDAQGGTLARQAVDVLRDALPSVFNGASFQPLFWLLRSQDTEKPGTVRLDIFFFRDCR